jgi:glutamyl-tRNA synthetase
VKSLGSNSDIEKLVLKNAIMHDGKADVGSVVNKFVGVFPEMKPRIREVMGEIKASVERINSLSIDEQMNLATGKYPEILVDEKKSNEHPLAQLKNVKGRVVMRMAPSPSGPLHLGHTRMCILNDEYVKRYGGELILRIEDTNPNNIYPPAYDMIPEDNKWLGVNFTSLVIQSERIPLYYERAQELIMMGKAYMCTCDVEEFKRDLMNSTACPHREMKPEEHLEMFRNVINGKEKSKSPVLIIKTDLFHPNPAVRDWIAFRVIDKEHPHTGKRFRFYPLMNFSVAIDDHELGLTHVIRGSDHINNTERQKYIFRYFGWEIPEYFHYGTIHIGDTILKTSLMRKGIESGQYIGWDDVQLATVRALARRGYKPETFRKYWIDSGLKDVNSDFSWDIFNSINRQFIDKSSNRYFFVPNPVKIRVEDAPETISNIPLYPNDDSRGYRKYSVERNPVISVPGSDLKDLGEGEIIRLKDLYNIKKEGESFKFAGKENTGSRKRIIQWVPGDGIEFSILKPDGTTDTGVVEPLLLNKRGIFQMERYAFINVVGDHTGLFLHR